MEKHNKKGKGLLILLLSVVLFACTALGALQLGSVYSHESWEYFFPEYDKVDLQPILDKGELTDEDYELLYRQTGLTKLGIDGCLEKGDTDRILRIQDFLFKEQEVVINQFAPFTYMEEINDHAVFAILEPGDILVSSTTSVSWWRYGHAALVINAESGIILESISPGTNSKFNDARTFDDIRDFLILRPKADKETKAKVVQYAAQNLVGIPYSLTAGIFTPKYTETLKSSQCAHLVWYAYKKFGIDLDGTGGRVVKPRDMACSPEVELVQAYGFDLDKLWN